jgi:hypothetical protein
MFKTINKTKYYIDVSKRKFKKYDLFKFDNTTNKLKYLDSFGDNRYEQFEDKLLGHYSNKNHFDKKRRDNYKKRHAKDNLTPNNGAYWSYYYLW